MTEYDIERAKMSGGMVVLKLAGIDDRNAAEELRGARVFMDSEDLEELAKGQHYIRDLIGLDVVSDDLEDREGEEASEETDGADGADGASVLGSADTVKIGVVADILTDRPQDIYVVRRSDGTEFMIPGVPEFIREIDEKAGVIKVHLIEGLLP